MAKNKRVNKEYNPSCKYIFKHRLYKKHTKGLGDEVQPVSNTAWLNICNNMPVTVTSAETAAEGHQIIAGIGMVEVINDNDYKAFAVLPEWCKEVKK